MTAFEVNQQSPEPGRVLVVDDEDSLRRALARFLRKCEYEVLEAETGERALALLAATEIDVVVSDITMPDMSGVELLRLARERRPNVPFLLITGAPEVGTAVKAVEYGAFEYITKPFELKHLEQSVGRAVHKHRTAVAERQILDSAVRAKSVPGARGDRGPTIAPGTLLANRYRIIRQIGAGGMGTVYEAEREDLANMLVAVKVLHAQLADRADVLRRFRREAELIATIHHANIVGILDFVASEDGPMCLVMELLRGRTLARAIESDPPISERRIAFIASQVLDALDAAHGLNVIHRDLKPENVFLTTFSTLDDVVKLLDFGIAKMLSAGASSKLTQTGTVLGTPAYMAPEYARGEAASALGDVYAVGCVMYEALTRRQPFSGSNYNALLFAIQDQEPEPIRNVRPDVSHDLVAVVARAMAKDPRARFESSRAMRQALEPWVAASSRPSRSVPPPIESAPTEELVSSDHARARR